MKTAWTYYLRDDGLIFREHKGTVQYYCLNMWMDSNRCGLEELFGDRFEEISKLRALHLIDEM